MTDERVLAEKAATEALRALVLDLAQAACPVEGDAAEGAWLVKRLDRQGYVIVPKDEYAALERREAAAREAQLVLDEVGWCVCPMPLADDEEAGHMAACEAYRGMRDTLRSALSDGGES